MTYQLLGLESIMITVASVFMIITIREKPKFPPSKIAFQKVHRDSMWNTFKILIKMKNYMLLVVVFTILFATYIALATVIDPLLSPFGFEPGVIASLGGCFIVAGVISTLAFGIILDKTKRYLLTLRVITACSLLGSILAYYLLPLDSTSLTYLIITLFGVFLVPIMAVGFAFATELTHPIQPVLSNGIMLCFSNLAAWMLSFLLLYVLKTTPGDPQQGSKRAILIIAFLCLIAVIATIFTEEELRRFNAV